MRLSKKTIFYLAFFTILLAVFYYFTMRDRDFSKAPLAVINPAVPEFQFTNQDGKLITQKETDEKVYVAEYFFTTCKGICPKMNANMRRVYDAYKTEKNFLILSHTCMPEVDSVAVLKAYEQKMIGGKLQQSPNGSYTIGPANGGTVNNTNWHFLTGKKEDLYALARNGYVIDNQKPDSNQNISDQFIHTQFFALVDKHRRVRGIYDGLEDEEIEKLLADIKALLKEKVESKRFMSGFTSELN